MSIPTNEEIYQLQQLSRVKNTDKCTSKWLRVVDRFNKEANISKKIDEYNTRFSKIIIPNTVKDVYFHIHY